MYLEEKSKSYYALTKDKTIDAVIEEFMIEYGTELTSLAFSYVKDASQAKDIVQTAFISCYQNLHKFKGESSVKTWLYRITINQCKDYLKSSYFRRIFSFAALEKEEQTESNPEENLLNKDRETRVRNIVLALNPKYKEVIFLYYYKDFSVEEISEILKVSANTVKTRLARGRERLKKFLEEEGFEWEDI
ncbi:RNA polymerase sigma-70 factor (ECF subfamily) [Cytobacillus eiseniae]|uniref:RNA polymerase sigma-70 factor (ECF subfamily) n=1 Tax=Cytobacillus eiseniae TaxID=762947 RepID=A0ABS4RIN9_9BACI|nr:sigma-70 family RNA polymerase sigma factor [Cytobacillus eiseniae]MBP2242763.1 RNA polymerase sigma-70 factor (ECF subfamily) [Cytobacillus eiseniae]